jgi:hypothetical protein
MKFFGIELKFNGFDIWHKGNLDINQYVKKQSSQSPGTQRIYRDDANDGYYLHHQWISAQGWKIKADNDVKDEQTGIHNVIVDRAYTADNVGGFDISKINHGINNTRTTNISNPATNILASGFYDVPQGSSTGMPSDSWWHLIANCHYGSNPDNNNNPYNMQIAQGFWADDLYHRRIIPGSSSSWYKIWDSNNLTKLSQLQNDVGFTKNSLIQTVSSNVPANPVVGQIWIQLI